jgi:hypothetical protein
MKDKGMILKPDNFDLGIKVVRDAGGKIVQGLYVGDVTKQNTSVILYMQPGEMKEQPTVGVGINNMLLDKDYLLYKHKIRQQLNAEGMQVNHLEINGQNIEINASYK